jgi:hypothetical protein
LTDA